MGELQSWLPVEIMNRLRAIPPPHIEYGHDVCACPGASMCDLYVAHAYNILRGITMGQEDNHRSRLWNLRTPERIRCFVWLLQHMIDCIECSCVSLSIISVRRGSKQHFM